MCVPYFYLVGVAKCGTTDLFKKISLHPEMKSPSIKEPNWLSTGRYKNGKVSEICIHIIKDLNLFTLTIYIIVNATVSVSLLVAN